MSPPAPPLVLPLLLAAAASAAAQERAVLAEAPTGTAAVTLTVSATGTLTPRPGADPLEAEVRASYRFRTRRVPTEGDGPTGRRAVRYYDRAGSELTVGPQPTYARLRPDRRLVVATGVPRGVSVLSPVGPLRYGELELLDTPLDPLLINGLLPTGSVADGESWRPADWVAPALAGVEAVSESSLECELTALTADRAEGAFEGTVEGATDGAAVRIELAGTFAFDRGAGRIVAAEVEQTVDSTPGPLSPGADLKLTAKLTVTPGVEPGPLTAAALADAAEALATPGATAANERVELVTPWGPRAALDRGWRFVNQTPRAAVLLRLENGRPVVAATLLPRDAGIAGELPDPAGFAQSVRETFEDRPGRIEREAELALPDPADAGRTLLLVRVTGRDPAGDPQVRDHYLLQDVGGERAEVVLSYPPDAAETAEAAAFPLLDALRWPGG